MKKITSKKCIALVMAIVMIITSVPLMMVSALTTGSYDPAPYWGDGSEYSAINTNFIATYNTDGSVDIMFPDAVPQKTYDGSSTKTIEYYIFTLTKITEDGETDAVLYTEKLDASAIRTGSGEYPNHIYYGPGALESLQGYETSATYDIAIHAVDSDGWFSDKIHTLLTAIPVMDMEIENSPNEKWVARLMLDFNAKGVAEISGNPQSDDGFDGSMYSEYSATQSEIDYLYNVNGLVNVDGQMDGMGYQNSSAYRYWISAPYAGTSFTFDTTWSRSHYNFDNAEEVWFYVDFSRVNINKVAFTLKANEKYVEHKKDSTAETSFYGNLFSTKAIKDVANEGSLPGVYIQTDEGLWKETTMQDGYVTGMSGYEGFVRIPIEYFVIQKDQYITADNDMSSWSGTSNESNMENYLNKHWFSEGATLVVPNSDGTTRTTTAKYMTKEELSNYGITFWWSEGDNYDVTGAWALNLNPAGTSIKDAVIVNERVERTTPFLSSVRKRSMGYMIGLYSTVSVSNSTYTITNANYAIQDILSAGFEVAEWTDDSVHKSFYFDQVMFCRHEEITTSDYNTSTGAVTNASFGFPDEGLDAFAGDMGYVVGTYYDRTVEVPKAIANYILQYFGETASLNDATAKEQVDKVIKNCMDCFPGCDDIEEAIIYLRDTGGHTEAYNRYINAQAFLINYFNADDETRNQKAVEAFEKKVELLDDPDYADYNDEKLKVQLNDLMALYKSFNLSHFEILGEAEKDKFITLYNIMIGEEVKTGYSIGGYPFIPFNDFETNYTVGQLSDLYYDDYPAREDSKSTDVNSTKNFVTWVSNKVIDQTGEFGGDARGWSPQDFRPTGEAFDSSNYFSRMDAIISNQGFDNSLGATIRLHGDLNTSGKSWKFATLSTTYLGQNSDTNWAALKGLDLSALSVGTEIKKDTETYGTFDEQNKTRYGGDSVTPNSFVMYVDFTDVNEICMNVKFILEDSSGKDVNCYFCAGAIDRNPTIYLLDERGDWEAQQLKSVRSTDSTAPSQIIDRNLTDTICTITSSELNSLEGYKGFIRIPLTNFRINETNNVINEDYICFDDVLDEYKIKQVKLTFWDENGTNIDKKINIDAMGFTYDPSCTTRADINVQTQDALINKINSDNGLTSENGIKNMDAYFKVKTNDSVEFEKMVAEIDPYVGKDEFVKDYNEAYTAYTKLSNYQRTLEEVQHSFNDILIAKYRELADNSGLHYDTLMAKEPWVPKYTDTATLISDIEALSDTAKNYNIANSNILSAYDSTDGGQVNYSALGFEDAAQVDAVIEMYEKGYCRLSTANKNTVQGTVNFAGLENAYNAAKRAKLIEGYIEDMQKFKQSIVEIYTPGTAEPDVRMVKYDEKITVTTDNGNIEKRVLEIALEDYDDMSVFAKQILTTTDDPAVAGYKNMHAAAEAIYDNSVTINLGTQDNIVDTISGGIITHIANLNSYVEPLKQKIDNRELLNDPDDTFLKEIEYYLGQTENFMQRYAQVDEINVAYHAIADQLPVADIASVDDTGAGLTTIMLTNESADKMTATAYIDLSYIATRLQDADATVQLGRNVVLYVQSDLTWAQESGTPYENFKYYSYYDTKGSETGLITAPINNNYTNGDSNTISPYEYVVSVDATEAANVPTGAVYTDTITFYAVDPAVIAEKTADGTDVATVLADSENVLEKVDVTVKFESTNGTDPISYTVEIPAIPDVQWNNDNPIDVSYTVVSANLGSQKLSVTVSNDGLRNDDDTAFVMTNDDTGTTYTLDYTTQNFGTEEFTGTITNETKPTNQPTMTITGWDKAPYGEYKTTLTYTASVN